jgi:gliding motility-associated-like protein
VADANGCGAAAIYRVLLCDFEGLDVPNAFTPNGDGVNDVFRVVPSENIAQLRSLSIYNRWGQKVWQGSGDKAEWDGSIDGKPAASDVYVWILRGTCGDALRERKGDVALLR